MNSAHLHLLINHFPVIGTYFSVLILAFGMIIKNQTVQNMAHGLLILTALFAIPAFLTGEGAEDVLESIGQKNEHFIHEHEEIAVIAFWICETLGVLAVAALIVIHKKKKIVKLLSIIVLLLAIVNAFVMAKTANSGGKIRHTEIRDINDNKSQ